MWNFVRQRVGAKIVLGYLAVVLLMLIFAAWQIRSMDTISRSVETLTHRLAASQATTNDISTYVVLIDHHASLYQTMASQTELDQTNSNLTALANLLAQPDPNLPDEVKESLSSLQEPMKLYAQAFSEVTALVRRHQQLESSTLRQQELSIENGLSSLRVHSTRVGDSVLFLAYGNLQKAFGDLRYYAQSYLDNGDERYSILFTRSRQQAVDAASNAISRLTDETQRGNMVNVLAALEIYGQTFDMLREDRIRLQSLKQTQLAPNLAIIQQATTEANLSIEADFRVENENINRLYQRNRQGLVGSTLFTILVSLAFGTVLARRITRPLQAVMHTSQQVAAVDLYSLNSQLTSLSQGDTALSLDITATPLADAIVTQPDEVGNMAASFNQIIVRLEETRLSFQAMAAYLQEMAEGAHRVAHGERDVIITPRSPQDVMGNALSHMIINLAKADRRIQRQLERLSILRHLDNLITSTREVNGVLTYALQQGLDQLGMAGGEVLLLDQQEGSLVTAGHWGEPSPVAAETGDGLAPHTAHILRNRRTLIHANNPDGNGANLFVTDADFTANSKETTPLLPAICATYIGMPIVVQDRVKGLVHFFDKEEIPLSSGQMHFAQTLGGQIAIALENHGLVRDLEKRVAERTQELEEARRFAAAVVDNSPTAIIVADLENCITGWNPAAETMFGYTAAEVMGHPIDQVVAGPEQQDEALGFTQSMMVTTFRTFTQRSRKDGTLIEVEIAGVPVKVDGRHVASLAIYHDISDLQQARQAAEQATRAKSAFLAMMSHEIRTPMNAIIGMSNLLMQTPLSPEQEDFAQTVQTSGQALLEIINDILDFSKIEAERMTLESAPLNVRSCVDEALHILSPRAATQGLELVAMIDPGCPCQIKGDVTRLRQILINLIGNGVKFTERGEVVVSVTARKLENQNGGHNGSVKHDTPLTELHFSVRDTGLGIPPERIDRLFQSFSQVDDSTTRRYGGTGLGLAISKRLCELMGGRIWVESSGVPGQGATFHFTIVVPSMPEENRDELEGDLSALKGQRCLIVDDNATSLENLRSLGRGWGMQVSATQSPVEVLQWLRQGRIYNLALIDQNMPEMDGPGLAIALRALPTSHTMGLVLLAPLGPGQARNPSLFNATVSKPIKSAQLGQTLAQLVVDVGSSKGDVVERPKLDPNMGVWLPLRILLAEDNLINQRVAVTILKRMGYTPDVAETGRRALEMVTAQPYDLILMDMVMPEMDGLEATRLIRQTLPPDRQPHIVAATANVVQEDRDACMATGMNGYMSKPFSLDDLAQLLLNCPRLPSADSDSASA